MPVVKQPEVVTFAISSAHDMLPDPDDKACAKAWFDANFPDVPREIWSRMEHYVDMLLAEAQHQNLIAASTIGNVWTRHIVDSLQLLLLVPASYASQPWLDVGSGAGLPAIPVALCRSGAVHCIESRALRCAFLRQTADMLGLSPQMSVHEMPAAQCNLAPISIISARAFAPLPKLLAQINRFSNAQTIWVLPKGKNAATEVSMLSQNQQQMFHVKPSVTDAAAQILVAKGRFNLEIAAARYRKAKGKQIQKRANMS